jgi:predicted membrane protein
MNVRMAVILSIIRCLSFGGGFFACAAGLFGCLINFAGALFFFVVFGAEVLFWDLWPFLDFTAVY